MDEVETLLQTLAAHVEAGSCYVHEGDLKLEGFERLASLPSLKVSGDVDLIGLTSLLQVGSEFQVGGTLFVDEVPLLEHLPTRVAAKVIVLKNMTSLKEVGDEITCRCLHLEACSSVVSIPQAVVRCKSLTVSRCPEFSHLRPSVSHWLADDVKFQECRKLKRLPDGFGARQSLKLIDLPRLEAIPDHLFVGNELRITECASLRHLGHHSMVLGDVFIANCASFTFPQDFYVEGTIYIDGATVLPQPEVLKDYKVKYSGVDIGQIIYPVEEEMVRGIMGTRKWKARWAAIQRLDAERYLKASGVRYTNVSGDPLNAIDQIERGEIIYDFYFISLAGSARVYNDLAHGFDHLPRWHEGAVLINRCFGKIVEDRLLGRLNS